MYFYLCLTLVLLQAQEISHLIACQPTALKAVRLQALVPSYPDTKDKGDALDKLDVSTCLYFFVSCSIGIFNRACWSSGSVLDSRLRVLVSYPTLT